MADKQQNSKADKQQNSKPDPRTLAAICFPCAHTAGAVMDEGHLATAWTDRCDVCRQETGVVSPTDFQWPTLGKYRLNPEEVD